MLNRQKVKLTVRLNMNSVIFTFFNNEMVSSIDGLFKAGIILSIVTFFYLQLLLFCFRMEL